MDSRREKTMEQILDFYRRNSVSDISLVRSGLGDAAAICDAIAADIFRSVKPRTKLKVQKAKEISDAVKAAGDAIWDLRSKL